MNQSLKLLIVDSDKDRTDLIRSHLGEEFYSIDLAQNWEDGLDKIFINEYNVIILSIRLSNTKKDASWFLSELEKKHWEKAAPFIVSISRQDDIEALKDFPNTIYLNKNSRDFLCELEWAIINLVPKAFYRYREVLDSVKREALIIKKNESNIQVLEKQLKEMDKKFINKESITETLGIFVAAFSLSIGLIVSLILLFFEKEIKSSGSGIYVWHIFIAFVVLVIGCSIFLYFKLEKKMKVMIREELSDHKSST